jgi:hypothetical protein
MNPTEYRIQNLAELHDILLRIETITNVPLYKLKPYIFEGELNGIQILDDKFNEVAFINVLE